MIEGLFWVWNFWFWDYFVGRKIWQVFFGWLDLSRDINFWIFKQCEDSWWCPHNNLQNLWGLEIQHGIFFRFIFGPGILGVLIFAPIRSSLQFEIQITLLGIALSGILPYCHFFPLPGCEWNWQGRSTSCIRRECAKVSSVWYYYNKYYLWIILIELLRQSVSTFCLQSNLMFILICLSELCNYINLMKSKFVCSLFKMTD